MSIDWTWLLIGIVVGWLGIPLVLGFVSGKRAGA